MGTKSKFSHNNSPVRFITLPDQISIILQFNIELKVHWWKRVISEFFKETEPVLWNHGLNLVSFFSQSFSCFDPHVCGCIYCDCIRVCVKILNLALCCTSSVVITKVEEILDEYNLANVICIVHGFPTTLYYKFAEERERPVHG